ncbi:hypothetical protein PILCRDRAFT_87131 [Piloderma croceum F 1598]|uniref:Uncharacterized protein n=1 Tax=Piloderma croceum (strain F 1598) TaxID=765440 RepID=A0A0C3BGM0_PILCF|nr:hypothetical protein PILCRDRAFT_87131 [Piloderma croceum F 1598]
MTSTTQPPFYILVSHSNLSNNTAALGVGTSTSLGHPIIQYYYEDDSPLSLLPKTPDEHVLILDYDASRTGTAPIIKSISSNLAITGVKFSEAPGAAAAHDELNIKRNDNMYILETCTTTEDKANMDASQSDLQNAQVALNRFKQRNSILRRALDYPNISKGDLTQTQPAGGSPPVAESPKS